MRVGRALRWYAMGSTNFEFHTPHWHGNVGDREPHEEPAAGALPMGMFVADMVPDNAGKWFFHCHVVAPAHGHAAFYTVETERPATSN